MTPLKICQYTAATGILSLLMANVALANDTFFLLENNTSATSMVEFYASPQASINWEENILNGQTLKNQERARITIPDDGRGCVYDLMAVFANGDYINQYGIDLCNVSIHAYTDSDLDYSNNKNTTAEAGYHTFTLTNRTSVDMLEFYASPQTASNWELNILSTTIQANGSSMAITLPSNRGCFYDFLAIFEDGDKIEKYGINVCELETHTYFENQDTQGSL